MVESGWQGDGEVSGALRSWWHLDARLEVLAGGMNSRTWTVLAADGDGGERRWVAKLVRHDQHDSFCRGLRAATRVELAGICAGGPVLTRGGDDHVDLPAGALALLRWVDGAPLSGESAGEQELIGATLAVAHRALRAPLDASARAFPSWLDPDADHLAVQGWVRPAVRAALGEYRAMASALPSGLLHGDPAPEAFLRSASRPGGCALIDWSSAEHGPWLYDVASALMYVGGPGRGGALLEAYARAVDIPSADLAGGVEVLLALRQAVQADYFARRLVTGDLTGIADAGENREGLRAAEDFFTPHR